MAADPARKRKLFEEFPQAVFILALLRINLRIGAFEIDRP